MNLPLKNPTDIDYDVEFTSCICGCVTHSFEHDDANRALMGSNMQRQAVPTLKLRPLWLVLVLREK